MLKAVVKRQCLSVDPPQGVPPHFQAHFVHVFRVYVEAHVKSQATVRRAAVGAHL